jgi:hypothetical protein
VRSCAAFVVAAIAVTGCQARHEASFDEQAGVVTVMPTQSCLSIDTGALPAGARLRVIDPQTQRTHNAVVARADQMCAREQGGSTHGYAITIDDATAPAPFVGIGLMGDPRLQTAGALLTADVDDDRHPEFFRSCTSQEGVHLTIWSDAALTGRRRWHRYYPLGYDVDPTCVPAESASGKE